MNEIKGMAHLKATLDRLSHAHERAGATGAAYVKQLAATYPPTRKQRQLFKSDRQRRAFFAMLRSGEIDVPYRRGSSGRSERLGSKWTIIKSGDSYRVVNNTSYGPFVMGTANQSLYHAGNWKTEREIAQEAAPEVLKIFTEEYRNAIRG